MKRTIFLAAAITGLAWTGTSSAAITWIENLGTAEYFTIVTQPTTSLTLTTSGSVEAGNSIILEFALAPSASASPVTALDSAGNTYAVRADVIGIASGPVKPVRTLILSAHGVSPLPAGGTITLTFAASLAQSLTAQEFNGINAVTPLDQVRTNAGDSSEAKRTGFTDMTLHANELLIGALGVAGNIDQDNPSGMNGFTPGAGYTYLPGTGTPAGNPGSTNSIHAEYQIVSDVGMYQADGILSDNANGRWAMAIATFQADDALVPEPASLSILAAGSAALLVRRRRGPGGDSGRTKGTRLY